LENGGSRRSGVAPGEAETEDRIKGALGGPDSGGGRLRGGALGHEFGVLPEGEGDGMAEGERFGGEGEKENAGHERASGSGSGWRVSESR
jgi:hypothetical protein